MRGDSPVTYEFPLQRASNAQYVFIWWRHHVSLVLASVLVLATEFSTWKCHYARLKSKGPLQSGKMYMIVIIITFYTFISYKLGHLHALHKPIWFFFLSEGRLIFFYQYITKSCNQWQLFLWYIQKNALKWNALPLWVLNVYMYRRQNLYRD